MWRPGDFPRLRGARAGVPTRTKIPVKCRRTWPGVSKPSVRGCSHGMRTSRTSGRANHSCQQAPAISQVQRSAASALRGRTVVQPRVCLKKRKACSTVKRRNYQRHSVLRSVGSGPPIQASQSGRGGSFLLGRRSTWTRPTLNGASGAPLTWRSVQASIQTSP
jgi:hypothetical protein